MSDRIEALRAAVEADPANATLRTMLAELLMESGDVSEALDHYERLLTEGELSGADAVGIARLALSVGRLGMARGCIEMARHTGEVEGLGELDRQLGELLGSAVAAREDRRASYLPGEGVALTFADVGGMKDVKKMLHRMIIMPFVRPELYEKYGRQAGGGALLYGPPGCGKTLLARAIAGECGLPFVDLGIDDVLSPFQGQAELNLSQAFEIARDIAPCVVFIDEIDALGYARSRAHGEMARRMTNTLLQELDGVGRDMRGILVLAASNAPWDIDGALLRPGRLHRQVFVPPPDEAARAEVAAVRLRDIPDSAVDPQRLARLTELYSGADLHALIDVGIDQAIERALETGNQGDLRHEDVEAALTTIKPSVIDWLGRARDYVECANSTGRWADVESYLSRRAVRRRLSGSS